MRRTSRARMGSPSSKKGLDQLVQPAILPRPVAPRIGARPGRLPAGERTLLGPVDLDLERVAAGLVVGMAAAAIAAGAGGERAQEVDLGEELDEVAGPHRARL